MVARRKFATALFGAVATLLLAAAPWDIGVGGLSSEAVAAPGGSGQGSKGNNGDSGGSKSGNGNSGKSNSASGSGGKGRGGGTGADGNSDAAKGGKVQPGSGDGFGQRGNEHINPVTGTKVEINGSNVEVVHIDGIREEITDGRYRMNDAQGRMIIERTATESDRARFRAMVR